MQFLRRLGVQEVRLRRSARTAALLLSAAASAAAGSAAGADDYPSRPIHLVVNTAVGGAVDITARMLAANLSESLKQPVIVENRDGAGGVLGANAIAKAIPDGYTFLYASAGITALSAIQKHLPFNPATDLIPVVPVVSLPFVFVTPLNSPFKTVGEFVALAKKAPGELTIASGGNGTYGHLLGAWLKADAAIDVVHVPYRGAGPALQALLSGQVSIYPDPIATCLPLVNRGKIRAVAISSKRRSPLLPDTPTVLESGYPVSGVTWFGILAPAGVPKAVIARINEEVNNALPKLRDKLEPTGYFMEGGSVADFQKQFAAESATWAKIIQDAGIQSEN